MTEILQAKTISKDLEKEISFSIRGIPVFLLDRFWPFAVPYVKRALDFSSGEYALEDIQQALLTQDMQLWLIGNSTGRIVGAATTEILRYPRKTFCNIVTLAGSGFSEWIEQVEPILLNWATANGCDGLKAWVRRGFVPKMKALGYTPNHVVVVKVV